MSLFFLENKKPYRKPDKSSGSQRKHSYGDKTEEHYIFSPCQICTYSTQFDKVFCDWWRPKKSPKDSERTPMIFWSPTVCHVNTLTSSCNLSPPLVSHSGLPHSLPHPSFQSTSRGDHLLPVLPRHVHRFCFPTLHCSLAAYTSCCVPEWFL